MRRNLIAFRPLVYLGQFSSIDRKPFIWIDCHTEEAFAGPEVGLKV